MPGGLYDSILFGMKTAAELMSLAGWHFKPLAEATDRFTMGNPGRDAIISGGENVAILDKKCSYLSA
jgi:hypothetical protein